MENEQVLYFPDRENLTTIATVRNKEDNVYTMDDS